jgi:hypothetical protein
MAAHVGRDAHAIVTGAMTSLPLSRLERPEEMNAARSLPPKGRVNKCVNSQCPTSNSQGAGGPTSGWSSLQLGMLPQFHIAVAGDSPWELGIGDWELTDVPISCSLVPIR